MEQRINALREQMKRQISQINSKENLSAFWQDFLGKKGNIAELMKSLGTVAKEERPAMGKVINEFKVQVEEEYKALSEKMEQMELQARNAREAVDITLPAKKQPMGHLHPLTLVKNEMINVFAGMGFEVFEGPEIEDDDHNFTRLNVPKDHPSRDMQDTFYLEDDLLLRTQTSGGQIRVMDSQKPPIKVLVPGRVFRSDSDATHSPMFHQMEGLVVDKGIRGLHCATCRGCWTSLCSSFLTPMCARGFGPAISRSQSPALKSTSAALNAPERDAPCASIRGGSKCSAAAWFIRKCWRTAASTLRCIPASLSESALNELPC